MKKHISGIHNAEEKESMSTVRSKVTSEHGNLARSIFNSKTLQNLYTKVALIFSVWICQAFYEAQVKTLANILMEWIDRQEELNQLKLLEQNIIEIHTYTTAQKHVKQRRCKLSHKLAKTVKTSDGKFHSINYIER